MVKTAAGLSAVALAKVGGFFQHSHYRQAKEVVAWVQWKENWEICRGFKRNSLELESLKNSSQYRQYGLKVTALCFSSSIFYSGNPVITPSKNH